MFELIDPYKKKISRKFPFKRPRMTDKGITVVFFLIGLKPGHPNVIPVLELLIPAIHPCKKLLAPLPHPPVHTHTHTKQGSCSLVVAGGSTRL